MKTAVIKRSILINGNKTSVSLENEFWDALHEIAKSKNTTAGKLAGEIAHHRNTRNLSSAIRLFVYNHFRSFGEKQTADRGHNPARPHLDSTTLRTRAEDCRASADGLNDEEARAAMLRIAADYEGMAANAARLERAAGTD
jgi:predicted DNA-binding ribbon-helix-helix protein